MTGLLEHAAMALDPVALAHRLGLEPDPWQGEVLRSEANRVLLNCSRQAGKTTVAALLAAHTALFQPGSLTLVIAPSERQSQELFRRSLAAYRALERPIGSDSENQLSIELKNGSRIIALPGREDTTRTFSGVTLMLIDEAARVEDGVYEAMTPMLAVSGGRIVAMSTPWGRRGWFYEAWRSQAEDWHRFEVDATKVPRIKPSFLETERERKGLWLFEQEYLCKFVDTATAAFRTADIEGMATEEEEWWDDVLSSAWI